MTPADRPGPRLPAAARGAVVLGCVVVGVAVVARVPAGVLAVGLVVGSLDAMLGMGLVLLYRAGGFVSFAQGQLGALAAVLGIALAQHFDLPLGVGILVGVTAAGLLGGLSEILVARRLQDAPRLIMTVATIGLAQVYGALTLAVPRVLDRDLSSAVVLDVGPEVSVGQQRLTGGALIALVVVPATCGALAWLLRTDFGRAVRAIDENRVRALLLGLPVRRISTSTWVVAGLLAGAAGVLRAVNPAAGFSYGVIEGPALILPGLTAAVIAGMSSLPITVAAALALGALDQAVLFRTGDAGDTELVLLAVLLVALLVRRPAAVSRPGGTFAAVRARPLAEAVRHGRVVGRVGVTLLVVGAALLPAVLGPGDLDQANVVLLVAIVALSLTVLTGYGGQVSLGQWAIVGVGAAVGAALVERGLDFGVAAVVVAVVGAVVAVLLGLPAVRVPGLFLAVTTLGFAVVVDAWLLDLAVLAPREAQLVRPLLFSVFDLTSATAYFEFSLVVLVLTVGLVRLVRTAAPGRDLIAVRDDPTRAAAFGIDAARTTLGAFALSGALAALAGYLLVFQQQVLADGAFSARVSLEMLTIVVIGGLGSVAGALLGTTYVLGVRFFLPEPAQLAATGAGLLLLLLALPGGLAGLLVRARDALLARLPVAAGQVAPTAAAPAAPARRPGRSPGGRRSRSPVLLEVTDLRAGYGRTTVVDGVDLTVRAGDVVALLGTNGAGKSTLLRAISGVIAPTGGTVRMAGHDITGAGPLRAVAAGVALVPGGAGVFPGLTVADHLRLAARGARLRGSEAERARRDAVDVFPELAAAASRPAGELSGGEQQMVALAQALVARPRLLMVDELSLGLAPNVVARLLDVIRAVRRTGAAVILVEQSVETALAVATTAVVLEKGTVRFVGPARAVRSRPDLLRSVFLGAT